MPFPCIACGAEAAGALLVHFRSGGHAVNSQKKDAPRADSSEDTIDVLHNIDKHFRFSFGGGSVFGVGAGVDDAVHVYVEVVPFHVIGVGRR